MAGRSQADNDHPEADHQLLHHVVMDQREESRHCESKEYHEEQSSEANQNEGAGNARPHAERPPVYAGAIRLVTLRTKKQRPAAGPLVG